MNTKVKKCLSVTLGIILLLTSNSFVFATDELPSGDDNQADSVITELNDLDDSFLYDGETEVLLGTYTETPQTLQSILGITPYGYYEYDRWTIYDQGITKKWVYLSKPYFIISVARGMTYKKATEVTATISASLGSGIPSAAKSKVRSSFKLNASYSKTLKREVTFSGPSKGYNSRDFYYKKGRHRHKIKIVKEHIASEGIGVVSKQTYYSTVDDPAIKCYSEDTK